MSSKKTLSVLNKTMSYVEMGQGDPIIFLHGNPTSSYLWRNIMPGLEGFGRLIAPDLIGMGDSDKLDNSGPDSYRFDEHRKYLDAFLEQCNVNSNVVLVVHDWGSALGFDWARRHAESVAAIVHMEAILRPISWDEFPEVVRPLFQKFRSDAGEQLILENNSFVEQVLPGAILRDLTEAEMEAYRAPFARAGENRRPTLTWPRELPIEGQPADVVAVVEAYGQFLQESDIPKLFINAKPGALVKGPVRDFARTFKNQQEVTVNGAHFIQEDSPEEIADAIADFLRSHK